MSLLRLGFRQAVKVASLPELRHQSNVPQVHRRGACPIRADVEIVQILKTPMAQHALKAKQNYKPKSSLEVFYTGGPVSLSNNGHVACACQDDIKVEL